MHKFDSLIDDDSVVMVGGVAKEKPVEEISYRLSTKSVSDRTCSISKDNENSISKDHAKLIADRAAKHK